MADTSNTGPGATADVRAADAADAAPELTIQLPATGKGSEAFWRDEITASHKRLKKELPIWKANLARYRGQRPKLPGLLPTDTIPVNVDFYNTEQKKAQLFYQQPDISVTPKEGQPIETAALMRSVLNYYLGPHEIDVEELVDELLIDLLCPAGFMATKIGFEDVKVDKAVASGRLDPLTGQPALGPDGQPETTTVPTRIWSRYFWERISPTKVLIPAGWTSTRYDLAPWLGFEFDLDTDRGREFKVHARFLGESFDEDSLVGDHDKEFHKASAKGWELWYRASLYDPNELNPDKFRRLVILEGKRDKRVVIHEDSPVQTFGPGGEQTGGMRGNPIHLMALRPLTDSAYPPSDCSISRNQVDELSAGRSQMVVQRRRNLPMRAVNRDLIDKTEIDKMEKGEIQGILPVSGDPDTIIKAVAMAQLPRENFEFNGIIQQDIDRLWALRDSTAQEGIRTATENSFMQRAVDSRLAKERGRVLAWYVKGVEKLSTLLQLFGDDEQLVPIVGQDGAATLKAWDKTKIPGRYVFTAKADSSVRTDAAEELERKLRGYNLMARDPHVNRLELLKPILVALGYDPLKCVIEKIPPAPPEPAKPTISLKAEDLGLPPVIELLKQFGITITPPGNMAPGLGVPAFGQGAPGQLPHPGAVQRMPPVDQHDADLTGQRSGPKPM